MESLKIDCRGFTQEQKDAVISKLRSLGYSGEPYPKDFYFYCIYASGYQSKHSYCISFGNNMKTFENNKGREINFKELKK